MIDSLARRLADMVALRKESVDRNHLFASSGVDFAESLSARRAWIEIERPTTRTPDRYRSLSARRAWIEISVQCRL